MITISFNQSSYTVTEGEGPVEVCLVISDPPGLTSLDNDLFIVGTVATGPGSAVGMVLL